MVESTQFWLQRFVIRIDGLEDKAAAAKLGTRKTQKLETAVRPVIVAATAKSLGPVLHTATEDQAPKIPRNWHIFPI